MSTTSLDVPLLQETDETTRLLLLNESNKIGEYKKIVKKEYY